MSDLPPSLAWLESFRASTARALGDELVLKATPSVNPLVYEVYIGCPDNIPGELKMGVWNLLQQWAVKNGNQLQGKDVSKPDGLHFQVIIGRRFGPARDEKPWR